VLQCVACVAVCCSVVLSVAVYPLRGGFGTDVVGKFCVCCSVLQCVAVCGSVWQCVLQCVAEREKECVCVCVCVRRRVVFV